MIVLKIAFFLLLVAYLSFLQYRAFRGKKKTELIVNIGLMLTAAVIGTLLIAGVDIPSPAIPLTAIFEPIGKWVFPEVK
ncbi:hypothetical protein YDYSG_58440 [Paenibacillus tyrfis]|uniref:hypothetical protein n=1 Tax=Paenibacillus tyrfis TaxID=1501230 RepID=UPI0024905090|nr:hypothetical protein [Paenibacillus tyrfis]GLI09811.1 hypothetical protein YDYSG_58440 [Paenibacillus tyrfis]